jgi:putative Ca2+/H+ antiporter (TMEM165/GDT1 family)
MGASMNWRLLASTFGVIFVAELGDKTQVATLLLAADSGSRWSVFAGAALALVSTTALGVLVGANLTHLIPPVWIRRSAGIVFIGLGALYLFRE